MYPVSIIKRKLKSSYVSNLVIDSTSGEHYMATTTKTPRWPLYILPTLAATILMLVLIFPVVKTQLYGFKANSITKSLGAADSRNNLDTVMQKLKNEGASVKKDSITGLTLLSLDTNKDRFEEHLVLISSLPNVKEMSADSNKISVIFYQLKND